MVTRTGGDDGVVSDEDLEELMLRVYADGYLDLEGFCRW